MANLTDELQRLREADRDLAFIMDTFAAIEHIYLESLGAIGYTSAATPGVRSSAEVMFSINPSASSRFFESHNT